MTPSIMCFYIYPNIVHEVDFTRPQHSREDDEDSDLSDVEESGYCDGSADPEISMRLKSVKKQSMKLLYNNTEKVSSNMYDK